MKDYTVIQARYLRDDLPICLGGLAANLRRVQLFSRNDANRDSVGTIRLDGLGETK
jgi:hypothetical protein